MLALAASQLPGARPAGISQLHGSNSAEELYRDWAENYDEDLLREMGWEKHRIVAHRMAELISDRWGRILDDGCGTGLCREALRYHGFTNLSGVDTTQATLNVAHQNRFISNFKPSN